MSVSTRITSQKVSIDGLEAVLGALGSTGPSSADAGAETLHQQTLVPEEALT